MRKILLTLAGAAVVTGCLSSRPRAPVNWTVEPSVGAVARAPAPRFGAVKMARLSVRPPYDGVKIAVLRADGSVAFDPFNVFAAPPAALLRGVACDVMDATGAFGPVVTSSPVNADASVEITVTRLAWDCSGARPCASVALTMALVADRAVKATAHGEGTAPVTDGSFTRGFSTAFTAAMAQAVAGL